MSHRLRTDRLFGLVALAVGGAIGSASPAHAQFLEPNVQVLYTLQPEAPGFYGFMASAIGDLNGDGASEFIIGAPRSNAGGTLSGRAYVYSGKDGALLNVVTGITNNRLGFSVAGVGDVNHDGIPDYAAGGPGRFGFTPGENGRVVVVSGKDHSLLYDLAGAAGSFFGYDINAAGDVNGDTYADLIVGLPLASPTATFSGQVVAISGRDGSTIWSQDGHFEEGSLGTGVSGVGDLDGDGLPEQCVGAAGDPNHPSGTGQAYVLSGRNGAYLRTLAPKNTAATFGHFYVHASEDFNGDRVPDIYVADFLDTRLGPDTGRGYIFSGNSEDQGALKIFNGEIAGDSFGAGRPVHDLDGDKVPELIISANLSDAGAEDGGKTYLISGKAGRTLRTFTGTEAAREVGFDALPLGDVNGDGRVDFLLTGINVAYVVAGDR